MTQLISIIHQRNLTQFAGIAGVAATWALAEPDTFAKKVACVAWGYIAGRLMIPTGQFLKRSMSELPSSWPSAVSSAKKFSQSFFPTFFDVRTPFGSKFKVLEEQVELNFATASEKTHSSWNKTKPYPCEGQREYLLDGKVKAASSLIEAHRQILPHATLYRVLDIGGGSGEFIETLEDVDGITLSASDMRARDSKVPNERYIICNAAKILNHPMIAKCLWDCIVCVMTISYLPDNARNLADFYQLLAPGGLLIVTGSTFLGMPGNLEEMTQFLNKMGYSVIAVFNTDGTRRHIIPVLILQKTHAQLNFPITYDKEKPFISDYGSMVALYAPDQRYMSCVYESRRQREIEKLTKRPAFAGASSREVPTIVQPKDPDNSLNRIYDLAVKLEKKKQS